MCQRHPVRDRPGRHVHQLEAVGRNAQIRDLPTRREIILYCT